MNNISTNNIEIKKNQFDLKEEFFKYLPFWYWFVIGLLIALLSTKIYLRYQNDEYQSKTIIKLLDDANSDFKMPVNGVNFFTKSKINIENEKEIIKSNRLLAKVVHDLKLYNLFYKEGNIKQTEIFGSKIPDIEWIGDVAKTNEFSGLWQITYDNKGYFWNNEDKKRDYNKVYDVEGIAMRVAPPVELYSNSNTISIKKIKTKDAVEKLKKNIDVSLVGEESDLLQITYNGEIIAKNNAILNTLNTVFDNDGREDRQQVSKKTIEFVNARFEYLFKELDTIELNKADYKKEQKLSFLEGDSQSLLGTKAVTFSEYEQAKTQSLLSDIIITALNQVKDNELLPTNIGLEEMKVNGLVDEYNKVVLETQKIITNAGENHPSVQKLIEVQKNLKDNVRYSLNAYQKVLAIKIQAIEKVKAMQEFQFEAFPYQEKTIRSIERQQKIKETLYLLLLQKREEASINLAITNPSIKIVDEAIENSTPHSPKRALSYLIAIILGFFVPFGLIYVYYLFDTRIHTRKMIEDELDDIPVIAEIPFIEETSKIVRKNDHSVLSEAFRILVANLDFIIDKNDKSAPAIFVSSTIKGEGKTFIATNLALTLASLGKKVIIVGTDLRNPQLHKALKTNKGKIGLVNLLLQPELSFNDCVCHEEINDIPLDIIYSGVIPPNPTEILANGRFENVLTELKQVYDYVVIDTAPTLLVADSTIITKYADTTLYLIKANYTDKQILPYINNLKHQNKIKNTAIIFNNIGQNEGYGKGYAYSYQYNYGYGYGYNMSTLLPSRFAKFTRIFKSMLKKKK
jgi:capsular exopolysaccharide synthesis family protein